MSKPLDSKQSAFANWLLLTDAQRLATGQPQTQLEWGTLHGVADRTLRHWKTRDYFNDELEKRRRQLTAQVNLEAGTQQALDAGIAPEVLLAGLATSATDDGGDAAQEFAAARQMLLALVSKGDKNALELWFKTFGKPFIEAEQAAFRSDFRDLSNDELALRTAGLLPTSALQAELARRQQAPTEEVDA